jgi:hypothetical protein
MMIGGLLLIVFLAAYFAFSQHRSVNRQLRDLDDHKQRCFDAIGRRRGGAQRQATVSSSTKSSQDSPDQSQMQPAGVLRRFSIR